VSVQTSPFSTNSLEPIHRDVVFSGDAAISADFILLNSTLVSTRSFFDPELARQQPVRVIIAVPGSLLIDQSTNPEYDSILKSLLEKM
jgi:hypothetical protein